MKKELNQLRKLVKESVHRFCDRMTPEKRLVVILLLGAVFTAVNLYMTIWAVYEIARDDYEPTNTEELRGLINHSINPLNEKQDESTSE